MKKKKNLPDNLLLMATMVTNGNAGEVSMKKTKTAETVSFFFFLTLAIFVLFLLTSPASLFVTIVGKGSSSSSATNHCCREEELAVKSEEVSVKSNATVHRRGSVVTVNRGVNEISDGICGIDLQIMVRTRGLGRALGHVIGRGDRDDSDDAPQHRWPTASARRQRVPVTAAHDEPVLPAPDVEVDVFPDDPMAPADVEDSRADILADRGTQAVEDEHEGFLGGPSDPSVLTQYADHVACSVWTGEERPELKLSSHGRKVHSLGRPVLAIEGLVAGTGLSPLIACLVDIGDRGVLSSFVERWHQETSSFYLLVGEVTITLDDVSSLLHLPVVGDLHAFQPLHVDDAV
ncbi:Protein MAIN-LIKE 1 [Glycine max]|nr:Protein MAIN-LIKE 1 [Glycine max]